MTRTPKVGQHISNMLRQHILGKALEPDTPLPSESELMTEYGASRASVREAIRLLESDGLVVVRPGPGGGIRSAHPDRSTHRLGLAALLTVKGATVGEFLEFRLIVEPEIARLAALHATDKQIDELVRLVADEDHGSPEHSATFHERLAIATNNVIIDAFLASFFPVVELHAGPDLASADEMAANCAAHRAIVEAVSSRDPEQAATAMRRHLEAHLKFVEAHGLGQEPVLPPAQWLASDQIQPLNSAAIGANQTGDR